MAFYDRDRGYHRDFGPRGAYGPDFGGWGDPREGRSFAGFRGRSPGAAFGWRPFGAGGYGRDVYGGDYPGYGGYPGDWQRGMHYGGRGYGSEYGRRGAGWGHGGPGRGGYDAGYSGERFVPEDAYRRHPELDRPQRHPGGRWPEHGHGLEVEEGLDDREIRQLVRQSLFQDAWLDADGIQVEVRGGVVTLTGEVDDYMEARYAWDDAWESPGVRGVVNNLTVRTDQPTEPHGDPLPQSSGERGDG